MPSGSLSPTLDRPLVVVHVAVSLDGATTGFAVDVGRFYELSATWSEDVTLTGADTILAQAAALEEEAGPGPADHGPLLAVVDSRARVHAWPALRDAGYWRQVVALRSRASPSGRRRDAVAEIVAGDDQVDLGSALSVLRQEHQAELVRVDSGGSLTGALLASALVDELSLLVHPVLSDGSGHPWYGESRIPARLSLIHAQAQGELVWLRYRRRE